ncbi:calcium/sodium antiporter [Methanoplanus sp. FWC-SCC4]|uniref:Calcium/sodium antiporter n=1 Tax=Methanochimaera problematica TaxID=2609417 RepID=A0AA97FEP4_9EURY|nr:calcium/sodium antiporter [Methanoplanus sp. FWC-SCC4]WOF16849.1 calcium/sodium antiporter [Methanoplanus sp. FWC-SCC4]
MISEIFLFVLGLVLLVKGADYFVEGGGGLASRYGVSPTTIGITVIAFGTSLPEFVVSINAVATGNQGIALGNILGSNIANIALVLALCALIKPVMFSGKLSRGNVLTEMVLMLFATAVFSILALRGTLDILAGIVFLIFFSAILIYLWKSGAVNNEKIESHGKADYIFIAGGLLGVTIGSQFLLNSAVSIATFLGIPAFVIGMSMVAIGTSLPELATSLVAILKDQGGISVGNILGSNIFNLLLVLGTGALIRPLEIPGITDVLIMAGFSVAAIALFYKSKKGTRFFAAMLLAAYFAYMGYLFIAGN